MSAPVWTDANGKRHLMTEMPDRHLRNAAAFMRRTVAAGEAFVSRLRMFEGGADPDGLETLTEQNETKLDRARQKLRELEAEIKRRERANAKDLIRRAKGNG